MSNVIPFKALLPRKDLAAKIISPPYDVVDVGSARELAAGNPHSFLHITRSEIDLPDNMPPYDPKVYEKAKENFELFQKKGRLQRDRESFYIYRQIMGKHVQTGLVGLAPVADYIGGKIKRHELTKEEKLADRVRHSDKISAYAEPVFLVYRSNGEIERLINAETSTEPLFDAIDCYGVRNVLWRSKEFSKMAAAFGKLDALYIADGHHRSAAAAKVCELRGGAGGSAFFASCGAEPAEALSFRLLFFRIMKSEFSNTTGAAIPIRGLFPNIQCRT
ncbi:MAG: DUF1015 domain-containing protein [Deltaproteobacteria bacterium]|nr:DUF1015 domain-containing protein [Deltaproteobacteria bacterium]